MSKIKTWEDFPLLPEGFRHEIADYVKLNAKAIKWRDFNDFKHRVIRFKITSGDTDLIIDEVKKLAERYGLFYDIRLISGIPGSGYFRCIFSGSENYGSYEWLKEF